MDVVVAEDAIFVALLLGGCVLVAGLALWAAHAFHERGRASGRVTHGQDGAWRLVLGGVALAACLTIMLGMVPGAPALHGWTAAATFSGCMLSILTMASAMRSTGAVAASSVETREPEAQRAADRKAA